MLKTVSLAILTQFNISINYQYIVNQPSGYPYPKNTNMNRKNAFVFIFDFKY